MAVCLEVLEDRSSIQPDPAQVDSGVLKQRKFIGVRSERIDAQQAAHPQAESRHRERAVGRRAAQPPTSRIVVRKISRSRTDHNDLDATAQARPLMARLARGEGYTRRAFSRCLLWSGTVFFYELREGDDDIFADVLLVREEEMDADSFFELVQSIRHGLQDGFEQDTLIEAIAEELERDHGFVSISDERLTASVNVSKQDDDNYLASLDSDEDEDDSPDYRGIFVELPRDDTLPN